MNYALKIASTALVVGIQAAAYAGMTAQPAAASPVDRRKETGAPPDPKGY